MPGPDTVVEESPVLVGLGLGLLSLLMWVCLRGIKGVWQITFGAMLLGIAAATRINVWKVHLDPAGALVDLDHAIVDALSEAALGYEHAMGFWFHQSARLQYWIVDELASLAKDTLNFGEWAVHHYGPMLLKAATTVVFPWPAIYRVIHSLIAAELPKIEKRLHDLSLRDALRAAELATVGGLLAAIAGTLAPGGRIGSLPHGIGIPKEWKKWRSKVNLRLGKLEGIAAAGVMAVYMANVFGVSARCLRSGNIGRLMRRFCGLEKWLVDLLLLGTVEAFIVTDLCGFTDLLIKEAEKVVPVLMTLVDVEDALIGCHGTVKPISFALSPLSLSKMPAPSVLAA